MGVPFVGKKLPSFAVWVACLTSVAAWPSLARAAAPAAAPAEPIVVVNVADLHVTDAGSMEEFKQVIAFANAAVRPALTYIAGDTPDGGTLQQYQTYKQVMDTIRGPVCNVAGDHEARGGGLEHYRKTLGETTWTIDLGRYHIIGMNSMEVDDKQLDWARKDLAAAKAKGLVNLMFIHHNFAGIKGKSAQEGLQALVKDAGVKLVLAGHTHNNIVINDGSCLHITTTSVKAPRGKDPKGYAVLTLDGGCVAWHFVPLGQQPVVAICTPIDKLMTTGAEGVVRGKTDVRVKAFDTAGIKSVSAVVDGKQTIALVRGEGDLWSAPWDSTAVADGEHTLKVEAVNAQGKTASEQITVVVNRAGAYTPSPATVSDGKPKEGKAKEGKKDPAPKEKKEKGGKGKKQPVALDAIPAETRAAIQKLAGAAELDKLEKENKDGRDIYSAKWSANGRDCDAKWAADGSLLERKEVLAAADVPAAVRAAVAKEVPGAQNLEYKRKTKMVDGKAEVVYEVRGEVDGRKSPPAKVAPDGTVQ